MNYYLTNLPVPTGVDLYQKAMTRVVDHLMDHKAVLGVYQVGSITDPGISDIDLLVVLAADQVCSLDPLQALSARERYPFTHSLFGISEKYLTRDYVKHFHFMNIRWLAGKEFTVLASVEGASPQKELNTQLALEFLFMNYISRCVESAYRVLSVRNLLLSIKGIALDLEMLGIHSGSLHSTVEEAIEIRRVWVRDNRSLVPFTAWYERFLQEFKTFAGQAFCGGRLFFGKPKTFMFSRNIAVLPGPRLGCNRHGIIMPPRLSRLHKKARKLNSRLNRMVFTCPMHPGNSEILSERNDRCREMITDLRKYSRHFGSPLSDFQQRICR